MTSRLDRLVTLLETGSTSVIRNTAAQQLADVQKTHPDELLNLLARILPYLRSKSWDTRTAAAKAIGGIVGNAAPFDPNADDEVTCKVEDGDKQSPTPVHASTRLLSLVDLDIPSVLRNGRKLLGSAGDTDDQAYSGSDPLERHSHQKQSLYYRLGLVSSYLNDHGSSHQSPPALAGCDAPMATTEWSHTATPSRKESTLSLHFAGANGSYVSPSARQASEDVSGLSKRQLNQLKRKNKQNAKICASKIRVVDLAALNGRGDRTLTATPPDGCSASSSPTSVKKEEDDASTTRYFSLDREGPDDESKVVSEFKGARVPAKPFIQSETADITEEWPFERMCEFLAMDLFDSSWEIRHGAAMGLREVIRVHGRGAGRICGKTPSQNDALNKQWLDDLACRLLCVFLLDRFGDYVSDNVVAPIRETVGQTLGALLLHLPGDSVRAVYNILHRMIMQQDLGLDRPAWEVCHGGMIGLKYLVAVRTDILLKTPDIMNGVIGAVMKGLEDFDDDVRAVSAATLIPIADDFVQHRDDESLATLMHIVWNCLSDLQDDLSASTGSVMDLLAKLCTFPAVLEAMKSNAERDRESSFERLVPRLFPFLRHTITSVRSAVLRALLTFLRLDGRQHNGWVDEKAMRLIFQNILVERNEGVLTLSLQVWLELLDALMARDSFKQPDFAASVLPLIRLTLSAFGSPRSPIPMDVSLFIRPSGYAYAPLAAQPSLRYKASSTAVEGANGRAGTRKRKNEHTASSPPPSASTVHNVDGHMLSGDVDLVGIDTIIKARLSAAIALGALLSAWDMSGQASLWDCVLPHIGISQPSSTQLICSTVIEEYVSAFKCRAGGVSPYVPVLRQALLASLEADRVGWYGDIVSYLHIARSQCHSLVNAFREHAHVPQSRLPSPAVVVQGDADAGPDAFSLLDAERILGQDYETTLKSLSPVQRMTAAQILSDSKRQADFAIDEARQVKSVRDTRIRAALAAALVALGTIPKKPSVVIKAIMESIKLEENADLQHRSSAALASLVEFYINTGKRGPIEKMIGNLVIFCCVDTSETPEFHHNAHLETSILSLRKEEDRADPVDVAKYEQDARRARIMRRGARDALEQLATKFGPELFDKVPSLGALIESPMTQVLGGELPTDIRSAEQVAGQQVIDALSTLRALIQSLSPALHPWVLRLAPLIMKGLHSKLSVIRYSSAKCFAMVCSVISVEAMTMLVEEVLPNINNASEVHYRQGVIECIYHLIHVMEEKILPYVIFLIVPVLGRMSDPDNDIRLLATTSFATLVKLVPLEAGIADPPGLSPQLLAGRERERKFMSQMLDPRKIEPFEIPVAIKAELRSYQQDGVNWLAFLNRYHLHGILCDDMGLGKTLQTICIVASDHHTRAEKFKQTQDADSRKLPSLIICPPSLSGHWQQEIKQYAPFLTTVAYVGPPQERVRLRHLLNQADIVITSYDICRNDNAVFSPIAWNYCVLDEGHLIKNPKAKITLAVKNLMSNHRLILSGTPIQNNVLELWSLFDFLMPGFLGTEKVFLDRFARPIAASRFSKNPKDQEAGALAVEALHKQVLPFLLRRLKEEVLNDLPPKILQNYYCDLSDLQRKLFEDFTKKEQKDLQSKVALADTAAKQHIFQALQYMRRLCNSPALVVKEGHKDYERVSAALSVQNSSIRDIAHAPKLTALRDLLVDCGIGAEPTDTALNASANYVSPHRALVFCQMKEMLDIVQNDVFKKLLPSVQYLRLDGSVEATRRQDIVNKFNTDPSYDVLLLTTSVGGLGLNLTGADTVIFVEHDWNPQKDIQAMDRAHRIGQKKVVNVYRLITRGTLEEKILNLQRFKIDVASTVVNQQNAGLSTMDTDQLLDLFNLGEVSETAEKPIADAGAGLDEVDMVDIDGQIKEKGKKGWLNEIGELWDDKQYEEEYNLDKFLATMK
ncbi:TATA-binding protein-associated factor mot1 [Ascosphaera acerosa]|nr:TATA-binding protein-associated factor mot1 [Ascosphaera acerosa]